MAAPDIIVELVERFRRDRATFAGAGYKEIELRQEYLNPFFRALGWDVDNAAGYAPSMREVIHEFGQDVRGASKAADYAFRVGTQTKFFVEAKKPGVNLKDDAGPAYQLRSYAYSAKLPLSILTDFEELAVYDGRVFPKEKDAAVVARVLYLTADEYLTRWDELAGVFSRDAVWKGAFDAFAGKPPKAHLPVDKNFLRDMEEWRKLLATNIANRNKDRELDARDLNFAVQAILDRVIFLRVCEDRGLEDEGRLASAAAGDGVYERLFELFREADARYNSGLFHFKKEKDRATPVDGLTPSLAADDKVLKAIIKGLYDRPYVFSVMPADILGQVYEQFLGKVIRVMPAGGAKVEDKPEVKKAGGVYYTPTYIVEYIVANAVGELLKKCKTPADVAKLRILDPACGSGSFLLGAYQKLLDWHRDWYVADGAEKHAGGGGGGAQSFAPIQVDASSGAVTYRLAAAEKKRILLNNIYGVDIDAQAVEVTKLSLLLKALEDESKASLHAQQQLYRERALPDLGANIKCGNSLIGPDYFSVGQAFLPVAGPPSDNDDERERVNAFDWEAAFPHVFAAGGFDAVIGNPPYGALFSEKDYSYAAGKYEVFGKVKDVYMCFIEKGLSLAKDTGLLSLIIPSAWLGGPAYLKLREVLLRTGIKYIILLPYDVFAEAYIDTAIVVTQRKKTEEPGYVKTFTFGKRTKLANTGITDLEYGQVDARIWAINEGYKFVLNTKAVEVINRLKKVCRYSFADFIEMKRGVLVDKDLLSKRKLNKHYHPYFEGDVYRYRVNRVLDRWVEFGDSLKERPKDISWFIGDRILLRRLVNRQQRLMAVFESGDYITNKNLYSIKTKDKSTDYLFVLSVLNSRLISYLYLSQVTQATKDDFPQVTIQDVLALPFPDLDEVSSADLATLAGRILALVKKKESTKTPQGLDMLEREIKATDEAIDELVYKRYGLSVEEIRIVDGNN